MPQLLAIVLIGVGLYAGYRWLRRENERLAEQLRKAQEALRRREMRRAPKAPTLERDPETGVYRPIERDDD